MEIYNFVTHDSGDGVPAGYIVMEYVGGTSLKQILKNRMRAAGGAYDPLPVDQALAYILEVLPAFTYLHDLGLVYCDFKPDNLIQIGDGVKLIDMGGVRRLDDDESAIYGTVGYQAPEVAQVGTSVASDIYTIGRTLLVCMMEFRGYQTRYVASLPSVDETPLFPQHDSLYRLIAKACAPDPADRFASVDELRVQLLGVLREVVAERTPGTALTSAASVLFEAPAISSDALTWDELPALRPDTSDAQYAWLSNVSADDPRERLAALAAAPEVTAGGRSGPRPGRAGARRPRRGRPGRQGDAGRRSVGVAGRLGEWPGGHAGQNYRAAQQAFNAVYGQVPGELAPKLALGLACELGGEPDLADPALPDLREHRRQLRRAGRLRHGPGPRRAGRHPGRRRGPRPGAAHQPQLHRGPTTAGPAPVRVGGLAARAVPGDEQHRRRTARSGGAGRADRADPASGPWHLVQTAGPNAQVKIGSYPADDDSLRDGLEQTYRTLAGAAPNEAERYAMVDKANGVRRWTLT